jgi:ABC-2 type transport system ATP-binding protein
VILHRGRLVRQGALSELADRQVWVSVRTPQADRLLTAFARTGVEKARIQRTGPDQLRVIDVTAAEVGRLALAERVELHQLITEHSDLEQTFFALTANADQQPDSTLKEAS